MKTWKKSSRPAPKKIEELGEFGLIDRLNRVFPPLERTLVGIGDDAAVLQTPPGGGCLLFSTDAVIEKVHFTAATPPALVGRKALAVNISDIAAMGGVPLWAVVNLGLPESTAVSYCDRLYRGLAELAEEWGVEIVGGDTFRSPGGVVIVAPTVVGKVEKNRYILRSGARAGDLILVTGRLGENPDRKHLVFQPRVREARFLAERHPPSAMIDLSDGLFSDLRRICAASGVGAELDAAALPVRPGVSKKNLPAVLRAAGRGEEFELLFTASPRRARALLKTFKSSVGTEVTVIGKILPEPGRLELVDFSGRRRSLPVSGWDHFKA